MLERGNFLRDSKQMIHIIGVDHHAAEHGEFRQRWAQLVEMRAEQTAIEDFRINPTPTELGPFRIRIIIRRIDAPGDFQIGVALQIVECGRSLFQKRQLHLIGRPIAHHAVEIGLGLGDAVRMAAFLGLVVVRNPDTAAGDRGGAADIFGLLHHQHAQPLDRGRQRRRQSGRTRADHQHVDGSLAHSAAPRRE